MEPRVGDRISLDAKKVGQPRRSGVVESVSQGLSGVRLSVRWDDGTSTVIAPGAGVLLVEHNGRKARASSRTVKTQRPKRAGASAARSKKSR